VIKTQKQLDDYNNNSTYAKYGLLSNLAFGYPMYGLVDTSVYKGSFCKNIMGHAEPKFYGASPIPLAINSSAWLHCSVFSSGGDILYLPDVKSLGLG